MARRRRKGLLEAADCWVARLNEYKVSDQIKVYVEATNCSGICIAARKGCDRMRQGNDFLGKVSKPICELYSNEKIYPSQ